MTGRQFNERYKTKIQRSQPKSTSYSGGGGGAGLSPRDTSYIITPEDATKKATDNVSDAQRLLAGYGDMMTPAERADLEMVVSGGGRPQEMSLKQGALQALGRLGETVDRPFQMIRHSVAAIAHPDIELSGRDLMDIMSGHDERLVERYGEDLVGEHGDMSGSQMLRLAGIDEADSGGGKFARFVGAMAIETVLDPLTWFTGGFSGLGKKAALEAMEESVTQAAHGALGALARGEGKEILRAAYRNSDDALRMLDDLAVEGASRLDRHVMERMTAGLREKIKSGKMGEELVGMELEKHVDDEINVLLDQKWLDEVDASAGVQRAINVAMPGGGYTEGMSWKRVDMALNPATGEMEEMTMPYLLSVGNAEATSWYGDLLNELGDVIVNKKFHNPDNYATWDFYLDHAKAGKAKMWTTGGITFGFGKAQKEVPVLTDMTRGVTSRVTRPLLEKTRKGPAYERWLRFRKDMNREGVQMVMAARGKSPAAASYAEWTWLRSNEVLAAQQTGFVSAAWRVVELEDGYRSLIRQVIDPLPRKEKDRAAEELGAMVGKVIGHNDADLDLQMLSPDLRVIVRDNPEYAEGLLRQAQDLNTLIHDTFDRAKSIMPELEEIAGQVQTYIPLSVRGDAREAIKDVLLSGTFPEDFARFTDDEMALWLQHMTDRGLSTGLLEEGQEFTLDHLYHLAALGPRSDPAVTLAESIGEKAVLSNRRFGVGGVLVQYVSEHDESLIAEGVRKAFEDQATWSRELAAMLRVINEEYKLGHKLDFVDVLETNPVVRAQSYVGQLQEAVTERVGWAAAQTIGRARRKSFLYDAGALMALGEGENGFYRRLSTFMQNVEELHAGLVEYKRMLDNPTPVNISGKNRWFPAHLADYQEFVDTVRQVEDAFNLAGTSQALDPGQTAKKLRTVMTASPKMSEAEALEVVANEARARFEPLRKRLGDVIDSALEDAHREVREIVERHPEEVPSGVTDAALQDYVEAVTKAQDTLDELMNDYVDKALGRKVERSVVQLDHEQVSDIIDQALASGDPDMLEAHAAARRAHAKALPERDPMRVKIEADAKVTERTAKILRQVQGAEPPPTRSTVREVWQGMQLGVDRASGAEALATDGLKTAGFVPLGFRATEGIGVPEIVEMSEKLGVQEVTADVLAKSHPDLELKAKDLQGYAVRTVANIEHTNGTVVVLPNAGVSGKYGMKANSGSARTIGYAVRGRGNSTGLGFGEYSVTDFLRDFEESADAPGVWVTKPGVAPHRPVIVVAYQPTESAEKVAVTRLERGMTSEMAKKADAELLDRQRDVIQRFFRDNEIERLNVAGPRTRKPTARMEGQPVHLGNDYRYGRSQVHVLDEKGHAVPAVEVRLSASGLDEPITVSVPATFQVANYFQWEVLQPTLRIKTLDGQQKFLAEKIGLVAKRVEELRAAEEDGLAEMVQHQLDSMQMLYNKLPELADANRRSSWRHAKRPVTEARGRRAMTLEEVVDAARLQYGDVYNTDIAEDFTLHSAGVKDFVPKEVVDANVSLADQRARFLFREGEEKYRSIKDIRRQVKSGVDRLNAQAKAAHDVKQRALSEAERVPYSPIVYDDAAFKLRAKVLAETSGRRPYHEEADLLWDWYTNQLRANPDATWSVRHRSGFRGTSYGGGIRPLTPTQDLLVADELSAQRLIGLYRAHKDDLTAAGIEHADIAKMSPEAILDDPEAIQRVWESLRQLTEPMALEDGSTAVYIHPGDMPPYPLLPMETVFDPYDMEEEIRAIARDHKIPDADTAPLSSVGYQPWRKGRGVDLAEAERIGFELTENAPVESGLLERLMLDPVTNRDVRRLQQIQAAKMKTMMAQDLDEMFLEQMFIVEREGGDYLPAATPGARREKAPSNLVYYERLPNGGKGRRIDEAQINRISMMVEDSKEKYRKILLRATEASSNRKATAEEIAAADAWFLSEFGVDREHLTAARTIQGAPSPLDPGSTDDVLRDWMELNHPDRLEQYVTETMDEPMTVVDWTQSRYPDMMTWFSEDLRKRKLADEAGLGRREKFAAELEKRRAVEEPKYIAAQRKEAVAKNRKAGGERGRWVRGRKRSEQPRQKVSGVSAEKFPTWEEAQWKLFDEAEARRAAKAGDVELLGVSGDALALPQAPGETPWHQWMNEVWEALMRSEGADQREAHELLEFYGDRFFMDPELTDRQFINAADTAHVQRQKAEQVHVGGDLSLDDDVSDQLADMSGVFDEVGLSEIKGSEFREAYNGYDLNDANMAGELQQGAQAFDANKIHMTEVVNGSSIVFSPDGRIRLPAMFSPERFTYESIDYVPPMYGVRGDVIGPSPTLDEWLQGDAINPYKGPERYPGDKLPSPWEKPITRAEKFEDATRYPENHTRVETSGQTSFRRREEQTVLHDTDEYGTAQRRPTGFETEAGYEDPVDMVFEGQGIKATGVDIEEIARNVVRWAGDHSDVAQDELVDDLRRAAGKDYVDLVVAPHRAALRETDTAAFRQIAYDMGIDAVAARGEWVKYIHTGDMNVLSDDAFRYMALASMSHEGTFEAGEIALDRVHRLNERMLAQAVTEREYLADAASRVRQEMGVEELAPEEVVDVASFVVAEGKVSKAAIKRRFKLTDKQAEVYLDDLADRGIVSPKNERGRRSLTGDEAAVKAIAGDIKEDLSNTVRLDANEQQMLSDILGEQAPDVMDGDVIRRMVRHRERLVKDAAAERVRLEQKHSMTRAEQIAGATGASIEIDTKAAPTTTGYGGVRNGRQYGEQGIVVGRSNWGGVNGERSGKSFGNPFPNDPQQKAKYRAWLFDEMQTDPNFALDVRDLKGKHLVCPGKAGHPDCHAETLARAADWAAENVDEQGIIQSTKEVIPTSPTPFIPPVTPTEIRDRALALIDQVLERTGTGPLQGEYRADLEAVRARVLGQQVELTQRAEGMLEKLRSDIPAELQSEREFVSSWLKMEDGPMKDVMREPAEKKLAEWAEMAPQPAEVVPESPPPIKVEPSPAGRAQLAQAREVEASYESQLRRLKNIEGRIVTRPAEELPPGAPTPVPFSEIEGASAVSSRQGMSIAGFVAEDEAAARHLADRGLYVGRKHNGAENAFGYEEGFLGNPFFSDAGKFQKWSKRQHPMFGTKYVTKTGHGGEQVIETQRMRYQLVGSPDEAAAMYHEVLWDWIETHLAEAKRLAARMQNERPNLYYMAGEATHEAASDADVVAEAFADVAAGRTSRPSNRWANIVAGHATDVHAERNEKVLALGREIRQDMVNRDAEIHRRLVNAEKIIADGQLAVDEKVHGNLADVMRAVDKGERKAVTDWMNHSEEFQRFIQLAIGEDVRVKAALRDGKPIIVYSRPGSEVAGVKAMDKGGLRQVIRRMSLPAGNPEHITVEEAVRRMGPELATLHDAAAKMDEEIAALRRARNSRAVPIQHRPTMERIAAAEVSREEFDQLMDDIWRALDRKDPEPLRSNFFTVGEGGLVPNDSWNRIAKVLGDRDPHLLRQLEDFVSMGISAKAPMSNGRWQKRVAEMMATMSTMNTADSSAVIYGQLEQLVDVIEKIPNPKMTGPTLDDFIGILDALMADGYQALHRAGHYDEATNKLVEGFTGPLERMDRRFEEATGNLGRDAAGRRTSHIDMLRAIDQWFELLEKDDRFNRTLNYVRDRSPNQLSTDMIQERNILKRQLREMLNDPSVHMNKISGPMVEAGEVGLGGSFAASYVIDEALGRELAHTVGNITKMTNDHNLRHLLRASNSVWAWWRRAATISRPSFHIRNFIGGMFNNMLIGVNPGSYFDLGPSVLIFQHRMNGAKKLIDTALNPEQTFYKNVLAHLPERHRPLFYNVWKQNVLETAFARGDLGRLPGKTWVKPWKANWVPFQMGGTTMEGVEGLLRVAAFAKYFDPASPHISGKFAKEMVNTVHFDYVNLTQYEERIKKYIPFFVWSRRNIPLQLRTMVQSPRWMVSVNRAKRLWNEEFADDSTDPMIQDLGFVTPWGRENDLGWAKLMWSPDLPMMDVFDAPLFQGRQLGATPFGEDARNLQKWALYGLQLAGPIATIPHDLLDENDKTTNAPAGVNELLTLASALTGWPGASASGDVKVPKFVDSAINSLVPFYQDYRSATGMNANNPYRAAREGMLPGEQKMFNVPGDNLGLGLMRTFGRGAGFQWATPMDEFFANRELERMIDEIRFQVRTRLPEAGMTQASQLEGATSPG